MQSSTSVPCADDGGYQWSVRLRVDIEVDGEEEGYFLKAGTSMLESSHQTLVMLPFRS